MKPPIETNRHKTMQLTREVRVALGARSDGPVLNSWAGWPTSDSVIPHVAFRLTSQQAVSSETGMVCDIKTLDNLIRATVPGLPFEGLRPAAYLLNVGHALVAAGSAPGLIAVELALTPQLRFRNRLGSDMMTLVHQFEFAAAHRLHCNHLTDEENRQLFGKCNYPHGHGHNYILEVSVSGKVSAEGEICSLADLQEIVGREVIDRFDHKHLNEDCEEFAKLNPTVENIAQVCWDILVDCLEPKLTHLRLYETPKTWVDLWADHEVV